MRCRRKLTCWKSCSFDIVNTPVSCGGVLVAGRWLGLPISRHRFDLILVAIAWKFFFAVTPLIGNPRQGIGTPHLQPSSLRDGRVIGLTARLTNCQFCRLLPRRELSDFAPLVSGSASKAARGWRAGVLNFACYTAVKSHSGVPVLRFRLKMHSRPSLRPSRIERYRARRAVVEGNAHGT